MEPFLVVRFGLLLLLLCLVIGAFVLKVIGLRRRGGQTRIEEADESTPTITSLYEPYRSDIGLPDGVSCNYLEPVKSDTERNVYADLGVSAHKKRLLATAGALSR